MCDTIAAVGPVSLDGSVLFGKNSDREFSESQYLRLIPKAHYSPGTRVQLTYREIDQARETHTVLLSKPHWIWGAEMGANSHGLVIGNEAIFSRIEAPVTDGIIGMDYLRLGLERARDVDEAIHVMTSLLRDYGQGGNCGWKRPIAYHNSFILADLKGAKVLETVDREWVVAPVKDYYAISNAMTIGDSFQASSATLEARAIEAGLSCTPAPFSFRSVYEDPTRTASGHYRRARAIALLSQRSGQLQSTQFFQVLRDHEEGPSIDSLPGARICSHRRENPIGQTTASWVSTLTPGRCVHWVTGTAAPCTGLFKPLMVELGMPYHGATPGAAEDAESLWWRHEKLRRLLDQGEESVRRAFIQERDALEMRFLEIMRQCPPVTDPDSRVAARRLVEACWEQGLAFESKWYDQLVS